MDKKKVLGFQVYGAAVIYKKLNDFIYHQKKFLGGSTDIEHIHQMRVASRRVRRSIKIFENAIELGTLSEFSKAIKNITSKLGSARDVDVQIVFLTEFQKTLENESKFAEPTISLLTNEYKLQRKKEQKKVLKVLKKYQKLFSKSLKQLKKISTKKYNLSEDEFYSLRNQAKIHIRTSIEKILVYDKYISQEDAVIELHEMRIHFKNLRYEVEIFNSLFADTTQVFFEKVKLSQEALGLIHDCDIWISQLKKRLKKVEKTENSENIRQGLLFLIEDRTIERSLLYKNYLAFWNTELKEALWQNLLV
jgi:CHAD domain-containing protein